MTSRRGALPGGGEAAVQSEEGKRRVEGICSGLAEVRELLGPPGAVERAADAIAAHLLAGESNAN